MTISDTITDAPPTSTAATGATEPEVVAAISSGEGNPALPSNFRFGGIGFGYGRWALMAGAGLALGYGLSRLLRRG